MYRDPIDRYFEGREEELVAAASRLIAIDSTTGSAEPGKPFGQGPARALEEGLAIAREFGLQAENVDGYVGAVDLNDRETILHILAHLDVVDGGTGWTVTAPFEPKVQDGLLYGRGAADDKGPAAAALLALRCVKELEIPLKYNARLIMGTDEETDFRDLKHYYGTRPYARHTFSPDGNFPLINIEKGQYHPAFGAQWEPETALPRVTALKGGIRLNVVPSQAEARLAGLTLEDLARCCTKAQAQTGVACSVTQEGEELVVQARGNGGHAAYPDKAQNALTALLALLADLPLAPCESTRMVHALATLFPHGDYEGSALGIAQRDDLSGPLTLVLTLLTLDHRGFQGRFDSRTCLSATEENCRLVVEEALARHGISITDCSQMNPPHHTPADSPFVKVLLDCYERYTGQPGECLAVGGTTYVHDIPGAVAFGCAMPGFASNLHGPDERAHISDLLLSAKIFAHAILMLCAA